jgi:hypothetical protein
VKAAGHQSVDGARGHIEVPRRLQSAEQAGGPALPLRLLSFHSCFPLSLLALTRQD